MISSGSRCAPLVLAAGHGRALRIWTNPDERSAGFLALGIGKGTGQPAALVCTSGTAAANYFPAVIEARASGTPLIVITADRPPRLRGVGASQTIDQIHLYGNYPLHFVDLPVPDARPATFTRWIDAGVESFRRSGHGPVHLNAPFDEPLIPTPAEAAGIIDGAEAALPELITNDRHVDLEPSGQGELAIVVELLRQSRRPLIVCGPLPAVETISQRIGQLGDALGAPILSDIASPTRALPGTVAHADVILRDSQVSEALSPDLVLRLGGLPTSKALSEWIAGLRDVPKIGIHDLQVPDPHRCLTHALTLPLAAALARLHQAGLQVAVESDVYRRRWQAADTAVSQSLRESIALSAAPTEAAAIAELIAQLPTATPIFLSNSMPIRWAEMYAAARAGHPRVIVNRGVNGIDGIISTAAGVAAGIGMPTICVLGDLTFLHDQNGLWGLVRQGIPLKLVVFHNDGGGVFHYLPIAAHTPVFEPLVAMPHGVDLEKLAQAHGVPCQRLTVGDHIRARVVDSLAQPGPSVFILRSDRADNHRRHQATLIRAAAAARAALGLN